MFILGLLYWMYNRPLDNTIEHLKDKFKKKVELIDANTKVLKAGYNYGDTTEAMGNRYEIKKAIMPVGEYRAIQGNQATALGLITASEKSGLELF